MKYKIIEISILKFILKIILENCFFNICKSIKVMIDLLLFMR